MQRVKDRFHEEGLEVWTDEGIEPGTTNWKHSIQNAILHAGCLACILSPDAAQSRWVQEELDFAELQEKPIFLILVRGDEKTTIPFGFATHQWIDIRSSEQFESRIKKLIMVIKRRVPQVDPTQQRTEMNPVPSAETTTTMIAPDLPLPPDLSAILPPPFEWVYVPRGMVTLDAGGYVPEGGKTYKVGPFYIAKYPITSGQYANFMGDQAYRKQIFWSGTGWKHLQKDGWTQPEYWQDGRFSHKDHPVVGVSWFEAVAFTRWLNIRYRKYLAHRGEGGFNGIFYLPTEQQWQRAAQGDERRVFPWGDEWDETRCNTSKQGTSVVTQYDGVGNSPFGVADIAGNVWEWCATQYNTGANDWRTGNVRRIWRGGSWSDDLSFARTTMRLFEQSRVRFNDVGFRIICHFRRGNHKEE